MSTVKRYKDLGLVFVTSDSGVDKRGTYILTDPYDLNDNSKSDYDTIVEFAWRTNTGVKPEFKGEIEVEFNTCDEVDDFDKTGVVSDYTNWSLASNEGVYGIKRWRPLLTQPKEQKKPIFTQEMAEDNALVPLGAEFLACGVKHTCVGHHVDGGVIAENELSEMRRFTCEDCEPLKTQKDIEIDMIGELINKYNSGECSVGDLHEHFRVTKVEE